VGPARRSTAGAAHRARGALREAAGLVVLDERTQHIDLPTLEMPEEAPDEDGGVVPVVSHDRRSLTRATIGRVVGIDPARRARP
jgi:ATPase subunit of ABC transporter with duplicated ATPase domains